MDMPQLWILMDNSVELPTDPTTAWTTRCVAHIPTTPTTVYFFKEHDQKNMSASELEITVQNGCCS